MKKEVVYYNSRDNCSKIHAVRYLPDEGNIICIVQIIHGMAEYVERYEEFAKFMTKRGCVVTGEDHLGHGKTAEGGTYGYFCEKDPATVVVRDVHRLKKMTQEAFPGVPYIIIGHSMGSFILRNYLFRYGSGIEGAVIMGTGMQPKALVGLSKFTASVLKVFQGDKHVSQFLDKAAFGDYNKKIENPVTQFDWLSKERKKVDEYIADPMCGFVFTINGFRTIFELITRMQREENLKKIPKSLPIFMVSGEDDPVGEFGLGVQKIFDSMKKIGLESVQLKLYPDDRHEILNETDAEEVAQDIYEWILQYI